MKPGQETFCNYSQLLLSNSLFTVLFAYVIFFFFASFVVRDLSGAESAPGFV